MSKKFWVAFGCVNGALALSAAIAVPTVIAINNQRVDVSKIINTDKDSYVGQSNLESLLIEDLYKDVQNKFITNADEVATDDSNLFYVVGNSSTLYQISPIAHILRVLKASNSNKKVFLYVSPSFATKYDLNAIKTAYPNFTYKTVESLDKTISMDIPSFNIGYLDAIKADIQANNLELANNKLYAPDLELFIAPFTRYPISTKARAAELWNNYAYLANNFKEINLIPNETSTITRFNNDLYTFYKNNKTLEFNLNDSKFTNAINFQRELNTLKKEVITVEEAEKDPTKTANESEKYKEFQSKIIADRNNALLYVASFLSAGMTAETDLPKINYYLPNTGMIRDVNDTTSRNLSLNIANNEYFAPYDFGGLDVIGLISQLEEPEFSLFWTLFKLPETILGTTNFDGKTNIIFDMALLTNDQIITTEATRIVKILSSQQNLSATTRLWLKPNANETDENISKLTTKVAELSKTLGNGGTGDGSETVTPPENNQPSETQPPQGDTNSRIQDSTTKDSTTGDSTNSDATPDAGTTPTPTPGGSTTEIVDYSTYIDVLDKTLPIEFMLTAPVFNTAVANTTFEIYLQYSPLYFSIMSNTNANKQYTVKKIFLTEQQKSNIIYSFGDLNTSADNTLYAGESSCFNKDIIWEDNPQNDTEQTTK